MNNKAMRIVAAVVLWGSAPLAEASPAGVSLKLNTLGVGADLTVNLGTYLNLRGGFNYGQFDTTVLMDEATVIGSLHWRTIPLLLDYHPTGGGFRISGGGMINDNRVALSADPNEPLELQGTDYSVDRLEGSVRFNRFSPYLGIGFGNATGDGRVHFACDFGVMMHGAPRVEARVEASLPPDLQAQLERDLQREVEEFEDDIAAWKFYPVVSLGFSVSF
jgi:opacity protein-like surface antigen